MLLRLLIPLMLLFDIINVCCLMFVVLLLCVFVICVVCCVVFGLRCVLFCLLLPSLRCCCSCCSRSNRCSRCVHRLFVSVCCGCRCCFPVSVCLLFCFVDIVFLLLVLLPLLPLFVLVPLLPSLFTCVLPLLSSLC